MSCLAYTPSTIARSSWWRGPSSSSSFLRPSSLLLPFRMATAALHLTALITVTLYHPVLFAASTLLLPATDSFLLLPTATPAERSTFTSLIKAYDTPTDPRPLLIALITEYGIDPTTGHLLLPSSITTTMTTTASTAAPRNENDDDNNIPSASTTTTSSIQNNKRPVNTFVYDDGDSTIGFFLTRISFILSFVIHYIAWCVDVYGLMTGRTPTHAASNITQGICHGIAGILLLLVWVETSHMVRLWHIAIFFALPPAVMEVIIMLRQYMRGTWAW